MRKTSRGDFLKGAAAAGGLALGGLCIGGCSTPSSDQSGGKRVLDFWVFSDTRQAWQENAWKLYKKENNPDFEIQFLILPFQQMHDKILIASQAGFGGPDIADIEISQFGRFTKGDPVFVDMTSELERRNVLKDFFLPAATDPWTSQNRIYGLGNELNTCLMSYRHDLYEKAGVETPIETWDEFAEQAKRYHRDTGDYLFDAMYLSWEDWWQLTLQQGGGFFGEGGGPTIDSPQGMRALEFQKRGVEEGWSILRTVQSFTPAHYTRYDSGRVATLIGPAWNFSGFVGLYAPETEGKWRLQPFPRWDEGGSRTATQGGTGVCVLGGSQMPEEAMDFVIWEHTNVEVLVFDFETRQNWPTYKPTFKESVLTEPIDFFDGQRVGRLINEVSPEINRWYNSAFWTEITAATTREGITPGMTEESPAGALAAAQREALDIIEFSKA
ncbi:MAG: ABC transporter substrate-binding protein [Rubrobacter sp.]